VCTFTASGGVGGSRGAVVFREEAPAKGSTVRVRVMCISETPRFAGRSVDELRLEDYRLRQYTGSTVPPVFRNSELFQHFSAARQQQQQPQQTAQQ